MYYDRSNKQSSNGVSQSAGYVRRANYNSVDPLGVTNSNNNNNNTSSSVRFHYQPHQDQYHQQATIVQDSSSNQQHQPRIAGRFQSMTSSDRNRASGGGSNANSAPYHQQQQQNYQRTTNQQQQQRTAHGAMANRFYSSSGAAAGGGGPEAAAGGVAGARPFDMPVRLVINAKYVGALIGQGGSNIRQICRESKAKCVIDVSRSIREGSGNLVEKAVNIYGLPENCSTACSKIMEIIVRETKNDPANQGRNIDPELKLLAHNNLIGRLIGKHGSTIKKIMEETMCIIFISNYNELSRFNIERTITVRGSSLQNVCAAENMISTKLRHTWEFDMKNSQTRAMYGLTLGHPMAAGGQLIYGGAGGAPTMAGGACYENGAPYHHPGGAPAYAPPLAQQHHQQQQQSVILPPQPPPHHHPLSVGGAQAAPGPRYGAAGGPQAAAQHLGYPTLANDISAMAAPNAAAAAYHLRQQQQGGAADEWAAAASSGGKGGNYFADGGNLGRDAEISYVWVPSSSVGALIGTQGSNIRRIMRSTGSRIHIDSPKPSANSSASASSASKTNATALSSATVAATVGAPASAAVDSTTTSSSNTATTINDKTAPIVVDDNGNATQTQTQQVGAAQAAIAQQQQQKEQQLQQMQAAAAAAPSFNGKQTERRVIIMGTEVQQYRSQFWVFHRLCEDHYAYFDSIRLCVDIPVPANVVGRIIGKKGQNIQELQRFTGAQVRFIGNNSGSDQNAADQKQPDDHMFLRIIGNFNAAQVVQTRVRQLIRSSHVDQQQSTTTRLQNQRDNIVTLVGDSSGMVAEKKDSASASNNVAVKSSSNNADPLSSLQQQKRHHDQNVQQQQQTSVYNTKASALQQQQDPSMMSNHVTTTTNNAMTSQQQQLLVGNDGQFGVNSSSSTVRSQNGPI